MAAPIEKLQQHYAERAQAFHKQAAQLEQRMALVGWARLLVFVGAVVLFALSCVWQNWAGWTGTVAAFAGFAALVKYHTRLLDERKYAQACEAINLEEGARLEGDHEGVAAGNQYVDPDHPYSADLDIFGQGSIFQFLNRTGTIPGSDQLANWLEKPATPAEILARQKATAELTKKEVFREHLEALSRLSVEAEDGPLEVYNWLQEPMRFANKPIYGIISKVLPPVFIGISIAAVFDVIPAGYALLAFLIQLGIVGRLHKAIAAQHLRTGRQVNLFDKYGRMIAAIENESFESPRLKALQDQLKPEGELASTRLNKLGKIISAMDTADSAIMYIILNGAFLWKIAHVIRLELWKEANKDVLPQWVAVIAEVEALCSLGATAYNNPEFTYPTVSEKPFDYTAEGLAHPMLPADIRVSNTLQIGGWSHFLLITGSNMAGKSTFLRTVGVNLVLASMGSAVCATNMQFSPVPIFTSMRIGDSLQHRESTFYAELKRLKFIIEASQQQQIFIILDEILKGTNSKDKLTGSRALIEQLIRSSSAGMIATHDLALADMETQYPDNLRNVHFDVTIRDHQFDFDYKLKPGVCQTMNATELMAQMGIEMDT